MTPCDDGVVLKVRGQAGVTEIVEGVEVEGVESQSAADDPHVCSAGVERSDPGGAD